MKCSEKREKIIVIISTVLLAGIICGLVLVMNSGTTRVNCSFNVEDNNLYMHYDSSLEPLCHVTLTVQWNNGTVILYDAGTSSGENNSSVTMPFDTTQYNTETGFEFNITAVWAQTTPWRVMSSHEPAEVFHRRFTLLFCRDWLTKPKYSIFYYAMPCA